MAVRAYLMIDGIDGPSKSRSKAINIMSFSFETSHTAMISQASGGELKSGKADLGDVKIRKVMDSTSPELWASCVFAKFLKKVELSYAKDTPEGKEEIYFAIELQDSLITNFQFLGSSEHPEESISFTFSKVKVSYAAEENGSLKGFIDRGCDVQTLNEW